ncbi:MAG: hypothetical protein GXN92_02235 [Candidatus Micrarchaeota archaeon]|nr:hypothetical protein [Candidatus Micrarchaeota archaeon]
MDVLIMQDGFLRDTPHSLNDSDFGKALHEVAEQALYQTIQQTPSLRDRAEELEMYKDSDPQLWHLTLQQTLYEVARSPDAKSFYDLFEQNFQQELQRLYHSIGEGIAQQAGLPDGNSFFTLSKFERNAILNQIQNVTFHYAGKEYTLSSQELRELLELDRVYLKIQLEGKRSPTRLQLLEMEEVYKTFSQNEQDRLTA